MSVDLPEPLAPRIPWMSPRSRRSDTCEIAVTGFFFRPTTNRLLTSSMRRAGGPSADRSRLDRSGPAASGRSGWPDRAVLQFRVRVVVTGRLQVVAWRRWVPGTTKAAGPLPTRSSGGPRGCWCPLACRRAGEGIKKAGGPIWPTALVRPEGGPAACGLARDGHRSPDCDGAGLGATHRWRSDDRRHHSRRLLVE